jgi:hypothetical protein
VFLATSSAPPAAQPTTGEQTGDGRSVVLRTETATFFQESDGVNTAEISSEPVNYQRGDGSWAPVDTTIDPLSLRTVSSPLAVEFASVPLPAELATVTSDGKTISFGPLGANPLAFVDVTDNKAIYTDAYPGVDLIYEARSYALKEEIVLRKRPSSPVAFTFLLDAGGLTPKLQEDGSIHFNDVSGIAVFFVPRSFMIDSNVDSQSGEASGSDLVSYSLVPAGSAYKLTVTPDLDWLQDPTRVYPVTIDPTFTDSSPSDAHVQKAYPNSNYASGAELKIGTYDGGGDIARSYLKFGVGGLTGKHILTATLSLYEIWSWSCNARYADVRRIQETWSASTITWSNRPSMGSGNWDSLNIAKGYEPGGCADGRIEFDGLADLVQEWADGDANHGMVVIARSETDNYGWKKFDSVNAANNPKLIVSYNSFPTITGLSPANGTIDTSATRTTPTLSAVYNDPDSGDAGHIDYQVCSNSTCSGVVVSGSGPNVSPGAESAWTVPAGNLISGVQYWWRARSDDGRDVSAWTSTRSYVPNQAPQAPLMLTPNTGLVTSSSLRFVASYQDPDPSDSGHVRFEVYDASTSALVASGDGTTSVPGEVSTWTLSSGLLDGNGYYWLAWSTDGWQSSPVDTENFLVEVGGDVYHASIYSGDPTTGGMLLREEWARINTQTGRAQEPELISTRQSMTCPTGIPYEQCEQVRTLTPDPDPQGLKDYTAYTARERHPDLHNVATILEPAMGDLPPFVSSGPLSSALAVWQTAPPDSGATYEEYAETDSETGDTNRIWIDARTRLPLKATVTSPSGDPVRAAYWTYEGQRITASSLPTDFFAVARPTNVGLEQNVEFHGNEAIGPIIDDETSVSFRAYDLGPTAAARSTDGTIQSLCFSDLMIVRESVDPSELETLNEPDPEIEPDPFAPENTYVFANYDALAPGGVCQPGVGTEADPALTVASVADVSTIATAARDEMIDPATSIEANPQDPDYPRAGVRDATVQARLVPGYVLTTGDQQATALLEPADVTTLLVIDGDFDKTTLPEFSPALQPR